jgi:hypothetical protein
METKQIHCPLLRIVTNGYASSFSAYALGYISKIFEEWKTQVEMVSNRKINVTLITDHLVLQVHSEDELCFMPHEMKLSNRTGL